MPRDQLALLEVMLPNLYSGFVVNSAETSKAQAKVVCGSLVYSRRLAISNNTTTQEGMVAVSVQIQVTSDTDQSTIEQLEHHVCETLAQQGLAIANCHESVVTKAQVVFNIVAASAACPKGYVRFKSGDFMVLGQCQTNTNDEHFALECSASGDQLMLRTFDTAECSGDSQVTPYALDSDDKVKDVHCVAHISDALTEKQAECQWAQFKVWAAAADACDGDTADELKLTLPIGMCVSANNQNAADLLGLELEQIGDDGLFWRLTTTDCEEFEATVYGNDECSGNTVFAPRAVLTKEGSNGLCFQTTQCNVDGVQFGAGDQKAADTSFDQSIAFILVIGTVGFCVGVVCAAVFYHFRVHRTASSVAESDPNDSDVLQRILELSDSDESDV